MIALAKGTLSKKVAQKPAVTKAKKKDGHVIQLTARGAKVTTNGASTAKKQQPKQTQAVTKPKTMATKTVKAVKSAPAADRLATALRTAEAIAKDPRHPQHTSVSQLLDTYRRGWVDSNKFMNLLKGMVV